MEFIDVNQDKNESQGREEESRRNSKMLKDQKIDNILK